MASGMNGQKFTFHGYLPIQAGDRVRELKALERQERSHSHIFIEAPYRNNELLKVMKENLLPGTRICIACDLESPDALIHSSSIAELKPKEFDLHKRPCIFIFMS